MLPIFLLLSASSALLPVAEDRFIDGSSFRVAQYNTDNDQTHSYEVKKDVSAAATTTYGTPQVLNLTPGISLLQTDVNNECYFVNTTIGTEEFPLIIDTGSAYLWVYGDDCTEDVCSTQALYTPSSRPTETSSFALAYVTGTASGIVVEDNIIVNKLATTEKFRFGMANEVPEFFKRYPVSGIFGLPSGDSESIESIISALYNSHAIAYKRFSIALGSIGLNNTNDLSNSGVFAIGSPVSELYTGDIHYVPLLNNTENYWKISIDQVSVNNNSVEFNSTEYNSSKIERIAIVDSGTTVLALPEQDALDLHSLFPESITDGTNFAILCNTTYEIELTLNGQKFTLEPSSFLGEKYAETSQYNGYCVSNIQGVSSMDSWILGAVFLKTVYADFDVEGQKVGFATRNSNVVLTSTTTDAPRATRGTQSASSFVTSTAASYSSQSSSHYKDGGIALEVSITGVILSLCALLV